MSFAVGTRVLLANGQREAISKLRRGQKVLATNTRIGKTTGETVTAVLVHHDTDLYDLGVKTAHGTAIIHTTSSHLFWDPASGRWAKAGSLKYGTALRTASGGAATVLGGGAPRHHDGWMWDLTITTDHDFYIAADSTAMLVHNCTTIPARSVRYSQDSI